MSPAFLRAGRRSAFLWFGCVALLASGCVTYRAHIRVTPDGKVDVFERAEALPGVMDSLHVDPRLAWTAFEATVEARGGKFTKDRPDTLKAAQGSYTLDSWNEFGQRGPAFKGIDEIERRMRAPNASSAEKDQYFFKDTELSYKVELTPPEGATVDSLALPWGEKATGVLEVEVPGSILSTNAPKRAGNVLSWPLAYGETLDVKVSYREWQWVSMVSVVLVVIFLGYLAIAGIKEFGQKGKKRPA
jgi:hypothetical protein